MSADSGEDPELVRALGALPREIAPPTGLEERTVAAVRRAGFLPSRRIAFVGWASRLAAALVLAGGGYLWGVWGRGHEVQSGARYLLLLREGASFRIPAPGEQALVEEYRAWAGRLRAERRLVAGEELGPEATLLPRADLEGETAPVAGFFIITARDDAEARAVAETCPHLQHGGRIEIRRIQPT